MRSGAELNAWSSVHGFAYLILSGARSFLFTDHLELALEELLRFATRGLGKNS
jgi:hypothetical protein